MLERLSRSLKLKNINVTPSKMFIEDTVTILSNIVNSGTKEDTKSIELIINGTTVDNRSITLGPKGTTEINFTHVMSLPEEIILLKSWDRRELVEVQKKPTNIISITAILATIIGAIIIFVATTKRGKDTISKFMKK